MKKKLLAILSLTLLFTSFSIAAYADETPTDTAAPQDIVADTAEQNADAVPISAGQEDIMLISARVENSQPSYIKHDGTVTEIGGGKISTTISGKTDDMNDIINYTTTEDTVVYYKTGEPMTLSDVKKDSVITVYTDSYAPAPLILPPQYRADIIIVNSPPEGIAEAEYVIFNDADTYIHDGVRLVNAAGNLSLNLNDDVTIVDKQGKAMKEADLDKKDLLVFYTFSTRSIPAQTTPTKVIVLGKNDTALSHLNLEETATDTDYNYNNVISVTVGDTTTNNVFVKDNILMVPLRELAEANNMTVEWFGMNKAILLNSGIYSVTLNQNSYGVGKMMPQKLSCAPLLRNHLTYVPVDYFTDILDMTVSFGIGADVD